MERGHLQQQLQHQRRLGPLLLRTGGALPLGDVSVGLATGDGFLDAASVNLASNDVGLMLGTGDGSFVPVGLHRASPGALAVAAIDVNRDGRAELVLLQEVCGPGQVQLLLAH